MTIEAGQALPPLQRVIPQDAVQRYAEASGDFNPLHIDPAFAATTQFGGTIVHGMHLLALLNEMLTSAFGERWPASGRLKVRFRAPARPGEVIDGTGAVKKVDGDKVTAELELKDGAGTLLVSGEATLTI
ncbi:MAG: MaoC family dehydratase [Dehalococcoidia bacterium]